MSIQPKYGKLSPEQQAIADELFGGMPIYKPERPAMNIPLITETGRQMSNIAKQARQVSRYDLVSGYMQKWPDGDFVYHSDYQALLDELEAKDRKLIEILTPNMLLPVIDDMDEDNLRQVIKTASENYSLLHAKWEASENRIAELEESLRNIAERREI